MQRENNELGREGPKFSRLVCLGIGSSRPEERPSNRKAPEQEAPSGAGTLCQKELARDLGPLIYGKMADDIIDRHATILRQRSERRRHQAL